MRTHLRLAAALGAALAAAGCSGSSAPGGARMCTEIGCSNGLLVRLAGTPAGPVRVEILGDGGAARHVYECGKPVECADGVFFAELASGDVRVRVTSAAGTLTHAARPAYVLTRPNGPDCPPVCRQATLTVPLPA
jgi:hypothetical protein